KVLRSVAERLISFAKRGDLHARRQVLRRIQNKVVLTKLFEEIGPSFADRSGGYTRILKLGPRRGDSSELCLIELVSDDAITESDVEETESDASAEEEEVVEEKKDA
ncbi:MAG: 50S ribosomal protein L17, partial [Gemmatimonadota bacterium]|nr:50S ribosomal protein L17 [Gemmatimonadota bacterium]